ncbi:MAG: sigma-54-dependent transcriptional regulator [Nitrospiraceae bacterium]
MQRVKVLIIEDDEPTIRTLSKALNAEFEILTANDPIAALKLARQENPTLVLLNMKFSLAQSHYEIGLQLLTDIKKYPNHPKVIVFTGLEERAAAARALTFGAYDVFCKPLDVEILTCVMRRACWLSELEAEHHIYPLHTKEEIEEMIGTSQSIRKIFDTIRKVATTDLPLLITGESGTGKELTARAIHERSLRKDGPFVPINCGAIPESLLESELFGHERGAFTGAVQQKKGKVEFAQGGTLLLDEVGELSGSLQVKLLRFLQDCTFERVGGRQPIEMNVRIMAATNINLKEAIERGSFREDLYYRLAVMLVHLPPLRDREEDALLMAVVFLKQVAAQYQKRVHGFTREAIQAIHTHPWPGNVRELSNRIRRAVVMCEGHLVTPGDLDLCHQGNPVSSPVSLKATQQKVEVDLIIKTCARQQGNLTRAAEELGMSRSTLYRRLRQYGLLRIFEMPTDFSQQ